MEKKIKKVKKASKEEKIEDKIEKVEVKETPKPAPKPVKAPVSRADAIKGFVEHLCNTREKTNAYGKRYSKGNRVLRALMMEYIDNL